MTESNPLSLLTRMVASYMPIAQASDYPPLLDWFVPGILILIFWIFPPRIAPTAVIE